MNKTPGNKPRLGWLAIAILTFIAAVADLVTLVPFAGDFVAPVYWIGVTIFLYFKGFGILSPKRFVTSALSMASEMFPVVQELPLILAGTILVTIFSRLEDKTGMKTPLSAHTSTSKPLNKAGVRQPTIERTEEARSAPRQPLVVDGVRKASKPTEENPLAA